MKSLKIILLAILILTMFGGCSTHNQQMHNGKELAHSFTYNNKIYYVWVDADSGYKFKRSISEWVEDTVKRGGEDALNVKFVN